MLLNSFLEVDKSTNYEEDFNRIIAADRNKKDYKQHYYGARFFLWERVSLHFLVQRLLLHCYSQWKSYLKVM